MTLQLWSGVFVAAVSVAVLGAAALQLRRRSGRWRWWALTAFAVGWALAVGAVVSPLDTWAEDGSLSAHIAQHVILGDLVAPLLLIGLPPAVGALARRRYERASVGNGRVARGVRLTLSPVGGLALWAAATYIWVAPPVHRLAITDGFPRLLDHASFLAFGLLVWLAAFDFRKGSPVQDWETLKTSTATCDLPWWGRHIYAMVSRVAMLPAVMILWLATTSAYYLSSDPPPGPWTQRQDQVNAASMMLGLEILLASFAVVLALIWVSISEGRARERLG